MEFLNKFVDFLVSCFLFVLADNLTVMIIAYFQSIYLKDCLVYLPTVGTDIEENEDRSGLELSVQKLWKIGLLKGKPIYEFPK